MDAQHAQHTVRSERDAETQGCVTHLQQVDANTKCVVYDAQALEVISDVQKIAML